MADDHAQEVEGVAEEPRHPAPSSPSEGAATILAGAGHGGTHNTLHLKACRNSLCRAPYNAVTPTATMVFPGPVQTPRAGPAWRSQVRFQQRKMVDDAPSCAIPFRKSMRCCSATMGSPAYVSTGIEIWSN